MKKFAVLGLLCLGLLDMGMTAQVKASDQRTDAQVSELIAQVKNIPVRRLDEVLPKTSLESWLQAQVGPDAKIAWVLRSGCTGDTSRRSKSRDCVEADVALPGGHSLVVMIAVGKSSAKNASVFSLNLLEGKQGMRDVIRLSDLPKLLSDAGQNSDRLEAA